MTPHLDALTLNAWADGLLSPAERQSVAAHLAECGRCRARVDGQAQMAQRLMRLPPEPPPTWLAGNIVAAIARRRRQGARPALGALSAGAAVLGLVLVVLALPDLARLLPALAGSATAGSAAPATSLTALLDLPAQTLAALASSTFDWASLLTEGAGVALLTGLVLLAGAAFGALTQLLQPEPAW